ICGLLPAVATAPPERPSLSLHDALPIYKDLVAEVRSLGIEIKGVMSTLSDEEADRVRRRHGGAPAPAAPSPTPRPAPTTSAAPAPRAPAPSAAAVSESSTPKVKIGRASCREAL